MAIPPELQQAMQRLQEKVLDGVDWSYIEGEVDDGEPDMEDDIRLVLDALKTTAG